jgi:hypothetical protein
MKLRFSTCIVMLALSANGATALTSVDPVDIDPASEARAADAPATSWMPVDRAGPAQPEVTVERPAAQRADGANPLWTVPLSALSRTRERPIFSASRRPPASAAAPAAAPQAAPAPKPRDPERPQISLVGTIANGAEQFGIFLERSSAAALRLKIGEDFQGWKLSSVQGREATLEKNQQVVVLTLPQPGSAPSAALSRVNLEPQPIPGRPLFLSAPQPRRRAHVERPM